MTQYAHLETVSEFSDVNHGPVFKVLFHSLPEMFNFSQNLLRRSMLESSIGVYGLLVYIIMP